MKQAFTRVLSGGLIAAGLALPAFAYTGENLEKNAKIPLVQAENIALAAEPGTVTAVGLRRETGGTELIYSFDILPSQGGMEHEVAVDADTGKVIQNVIDYNYP